MGIAVWIIVALAAIMYLEGALVSLVSTAMLRPPKWAATLMVLFWPIALPYITFKAYKAFEPIIMQMQQLQQLQTTLQSNPLMGELMNNMEDLNKDQVGQNL